MGEAGTLSRVKHGRGDREAGAKVGLSKVDALARRLSSGASASPRQFGALQVCE